MSLEALLQVLVSDEKIRPDRPPLFSPTFMTIGTRVNCVLDFVRPSGFCLTHIPDPSWSNQRVVPCLVLVHGATTVLVE